MKKVLIIGVGFLGSYIIKQLEKNHIDTIGTRITSNSRFTSLDITDKENIEKVISKHRPDCIVNCAARVDVDFLEKSPQIAYSINSEGVKNLAEVSGKYNTRLVHISTDSVFDGIQGFYNENDLPNPINVYGKSKELGERHIRNFHKNHVIIRTNFYGIHNEGKFLFNWIVDSLKSNKHIRGFNDVIFSPVEIGNLSEIIQEFILNSFIGTVHISSYDSMSKYDFALKIAQLFGFDSSIITEKSVDGFNFVAKRPKNTSLDNKNASKILKTKILSIEEGLQKLKKLKG